MKSKTIVIVGAGFCGSTLATRLLRQHSINSLNIVLITRAGTLGRGVAYGTHAGAHVLNVPAGRMGALAEKEDGFYEYAVQHDPNMTPGSFIERTVYGDYLTTLLNDASKDTPTSTKLKILIGEVIRVTSSKSGKSARLILESGEYVDADTVVLSTGHCARQKPAIASKYRSFYESPRYVHDPWQSDALGNIEESAPLLLIGSGLTMLDVVLDLRDRGHKGMIYSVSRRGLPPQPHRVLSSHPHYDGKLSQQMLENCTTRHYVRAVRDAVKLQALNGGDWRDVIGGLRSTTTQLWHALPAIERQRFLRHVRPYWDTHRHRCAPQPGARMQAEIDSGKLKLLAGRVTGYDSNSDHVNVHLRRRSAQSEECIEVGAVINCTTPVFDLRKLDNPLLTSLRTSGLLIPDALGTSMEIAPSGALVDCNLEESRWLYYVGPFLQARDWEATAVPELREYVKRMAETITTSLSPP